MDLLGVLDGHLQTTIDKFDAMGLVIGEDTVAAANAFGTQLGLMGKQLLGIVATIIGPLLPGLSALGSVLLNVGEVVKTVLVFAIKALQTAVGGLLWGLAEMLGTMANLATKIPLVGKHLGFMGDAAVLLHGYAEGTADAVGQLWQETEKTGTAAGKTAPAILNLGKNFEEAETKAKKLADEFKRNTAAAHEVEAGFHRLHGAGLTVNKMASEQVQAFNDLRQRVMHLERSELELALGQRGLVREFSALGPVIRPATSDLDAFNQELREMDFVGPIQETLPRFKKFAFDITGIFGDLIWGINNIWTGGMEGLINVARSAATRLIAPLLDAIVPGLGQIAGLVEGALEWIGRKIGGFFKWVWGGIKGLFGFGGSQEPTRLPEPPPDPENEFALGTQGRFLDFGRGTRVMLHGRERIMTANEASGVTVNIYNPSVRSDQDIREITRQVAQAFRLTHKVAAA